MIEELMEEDHLTQLLQNNGYDVYVMQPTETAAEFITRVIEANESRAPDLR